MSDIAVKLLSEILTEIKGIRSCQPEKARRIYKTKSEPGLPIQEWFEQAWAAYPRKEGKKDAVRFFKAFIKSKQDFSDIMKSIKNYEELTEDRPKFRKNGATFFNENWKDYVDYEDVKPKTENEIARERFLGK